MRITTLRNRCYHLLVCILFACAWVPLLTAKEGGVPEAFTPNRKPVLSIPRFAEGMVSIDGNLNETVWKQAARVGNFCEIRPGDNVCPPVNTEALVGYDDKNIYFAFIAHDNPADIRVSLQDRDRIFNDDFIGIILDTYQSSSWAYELFVNPIGIQGDLRWTNGGNEDEALDIIFDSKGIITDSGYQVEMAVPFSSLRFPDKPIQSWDFTILRIHPRETRRQICWTENSRDNSCWPCQFGTLTGISAIHSGSSLQILPSVVGSLSRALSQANNPYSPFETAPLKPEFGVSIRYPFSSNLSVEAAVNPDFSQVESDVALIDVNSTFSLFYPERRPFFSEGADLYQTRINAVYSRSINNPIVAAKLTGGFGNTNFGVISALDEETPIIVPLEERSMYGTARKSMTHIARLQHSFSNGSNIGCILTDRHFDGGGFGINGGFDGLYRFWDNFQVEGQLLVNSMHEPNLPTVITSAETFDHARHTAKLDGESFTGFDAYTGLRHYGRNFMLELTTTHTSSGFRAETGFEPRANQQRMNLWVAYKVYSNGKVVEDWQPSFSAGRVWNFDGTIKDGWLDPSINIRLSGQTSVSMDYLISGELFRGTYFGGIRRFSANFSTRYSEVLQGDANVTVGRSIARNTSVPALGRILSAGGSCTLKPLDRLNIQQSVDYSRLDYPSGENIFAGAVVRTRVNYQHSRELSARVVVQYDSFSREVSFEPLVSYKLNPFSIFYFGSTNRWHNFDDELKPGGTEHYDDTYHLSSQGFFFKVQYLFQI